MIVVISCAGSKHSDRPFKDLNGTPLEFVANPANAPASTTKSYVRPDDIAGDGISWRENVRRYNERGSNPFMLYKTYELYKPLVYRDLVGAFGVENTFILSAGWGLVRSDYLIPHYDITFSSAAPSYKRRNKSDDYRDFCHLPRSSKSTIYFFGGADYVPIFCTLTAGANGKRVVFYNSKVVPEAPGCSLENYGKPKHTTNWHYACAKKFLKDHS